MAEHVTQVQLELFGIEAAEAPSRDRSCRTTGRGTVERRRKALGVELLDGLEVVRPFDIPKMRACHVAPERLIAFSEVRTGRFPEELPPETAFVHFYEHDEKFTSFEDQIETYVQRLSRVAGFVAPDFSVYRNMPEALKIHNTYRNFALGAALQKKGFEVIPNVRLSGEQSVSYALAGVPEDSYLAVGLHGCIADSENREFVKRELRLIQDLCRPRGLVLYGAFGHSFLEGAVGPGLELIQFRPTFGLGPSKRLAA